MKTLIRTAALLAISASLAACGGMSTRERDTAVGAGAGAVGGALLSNGNPAGVVGGAVVGGVVGNQVGKR